MLESLAAGLLNRVLGAYVENFDSTQLNVGIWSGDVKLRNLKLRKESLDALDLPIDVKYGYLGELTLAVPWKSLKNRPVKILIDGVHLLCGPRDEEGEDEKDDEERELRFKLRKLEEIEEISKAATTAIGDNQEQNETFTQSLLTKIVDNLQVSIKNIHVRYEDMEGIFGEEPYAVGLTLSEISAVSTNENWVPSFISMTTAITQKLLTLDSLAVYWNSNADSISSTDHDQLRLRMENSICSANNAVDHKFLLRPVSGCGRLTLNKAGSTEKQPHIDVKLLFEEFGLDISDVQYQDILNTASKIHWYKKTVKFRRQRPKCSVSDDPRAWFAYAARSIYQEIHGRNYKMSWDFIKWRRDKRIEYIGLWKKHLASEHNAKMSLNEEDEAELKELHKILSLEDIKLFRAMASKQFRTESREAKLSGSEQGETNKNAGWFSSWWSGGSSNEEQQDKLELTDEQRKELYDAIEFDETKILSEAISLPRDRVVTSASCLLKKGSLRFINDSKSLKLGEVIFENCETDFYQRPDSMLATFRLREFKVEDGSPNTLYKHIVSVKNLQIQDEEGETSDQEPFFKVALEQNPLDNSADTKVELQLKSMTVFYHVHFVNEIIRLFDPPRKHLDTIGAIMNAAEATVGGWTAQSRMGVEAILEDHKTVNVEMDLQAPLIIIPLNPHVWDTPCAVIDAGHISLASDLVPKEKIKEMKAMSPEEYDKIAPQDIKRLMFDRFKLKLNDMQFLVGPDIRSTISKLNLSDRESNSVILDRMEMELDVDISILPRALTLPKIAIYGKLPLLKLSINDYQYKVLMKLIDNCLPQFGNFGTEHSGFEGNFLTDNEVSTSQSQFARESQMLQEQLDGLKKMTPTELNQRIFQLKFDIELIHVWLHKCTDEGSMGTTPLVNLVGKNFELDLGKKAKNFELDLALHSLDIEDFIEDTQVNETGWIVQSTHAHSGDDSDLFKISLVRSQRIVTHKGFLIAVADQDVMMSMTELKFTLNPKTILTLINFAITTFTDPNGPEMPVDALKHNAPDTEDAPQKINFHLSMDNVIVLLSDESTDIATLELSAAEIALFLLPESMNLKASLGGIDLTNEIHKGLPKTSPLRKLITISDNELVELTYETFDPAKNSNNFSSSFDYRTGSMVINVVDDALNRLLNYAAKFQRMKGLFDHARELAYDQAGNIESVNNMKLNINVKAPVIIFPKLIDPGKETYDSITFYLGQLYVQNTFKESDNVLINTISSGIKSGTISSIFHMENNLLQELHIIQDLAMHFDITHKPANGDDGGSFDVKGYFEPLSARLTDLQLQYMYVLSQNLPKALQIDQSDLVVAEDAAVDVSALMFPKGESELSEASSRPQESSNDRKISLSMEFAAPNTSLTLYSETKGCKSVDECAMTRLTFHDFGMVLKTNDDMELNAEIHTFSFTVEDIRKEKENEFTELIPKTSGDNNQFMATVVERKLGSSSVFNISVTVDTPRLILALDYLFALKAFFDPTLSVKPPAKINSEEGQLKENDSISGEGSLKIHYSLNVVDGSIILLSDPSDKNTEAIVFSAGQLMIADQNIMSANANNLGMFLCRMGSFDENRIRLLDDFSSSIAVDTRDSNAEKFLTSVHISVEPIVMRLSLRDIRLALAIFDKAMKLAKSHGLASEPTSEETDFKTKYGSFSKDFKRTLSKYAPSIVSSASFLSSRNKTRRNEEAILTAEKLNADVEGLRMVLIGDVHELPIIDMNVRPFNISANNWSNDVELLSTIELYANIFNYSRSSWEPLVEAFPISFHVSRGSDTNAALVFDVVSSKIASLSLSSRTIALLSQIPSSIYDHQDLTVRGAEKPYKIVNDTGMTLNVWIASEDESQRNQLTILESMECLPWEFEDWRRVRENLDTDSTMNMLGVEVADKKYESSLRIDVTAEGEDVYTLRPPKNGIHTRLACELTLGDDNVKTVTIRSTIVLQNSTSNILEFKMAGEETIQELNPGESRSIPAEKAYETEVILRPKGNFEWPSRSIRWRQLLNRPQTVTCRNKSQDNLFHFEIDAQYDHNEPLARVYPHMKVIISSPLILENLLPYDMSYRLLWKESKPTGFTRKDQSELHQLAKGQKVLIHSVTLDDFLLLEIHPDEEDISISEQCLINTPYRSELQPESRLSLRYKTGQKLFLNAHYKNVEGSRAKIVSIYSPYVILNGTNRDLQIEGDNNNITLAKVLLTEDGNRFSKPTMFSFNRDKSNRNRASVRFNDSDWSIRTSFDAIGQAVDLTMSIPNKNLESNIGITVTEGEGRYAFSKLIHIQPRYIIRNELDADIEVSEFGSTNVFIVQTNISYPLYKMRSISNKHLILKYLGSNSAWSAPFMIKDIGSTYVKVLTRGKGHQLLKLDIVLEGATIFINIGHADGSWPYSIRNFSDHEFIFYQRDPRTFDNDDDYELYDDLADMDYEPLFYKVPPRSVMPYAWDYPAARQKKLILVARKRKREVQLAEIGNLKPMRLPVTAQNEQRAIVDLNVVADGPTQALVISNYNPEFSLYKLRSAQNTSTSLSTERGDQFEVQEEDRNVHTKIIFAFEGVGISLINTKLQELCYITLNNLELRYNESDLYQTVSCKLKWIQIDNQLFTGIFPNILYPTAIQKTSKELDYHPVLSGSVSKVKDDTHGVLYFKHATLLLQELTIQLDEDFLMALIDFSKIPGASWLHEAEDSLCDSYAMLVRPVELQRQNDIYFEMFHLQPTMLHLSFVRTEDLNPEDEKVGPQNALLFFVNVLTMALGNINDAPIKLNSLYMDNVKVPLPMLMSAIQTHYGQQFFYQIHKVLGSADFLGNPVGLFNNISSGVWDIFYEPYQGYMLNDRPQELGISIAKGGLSFVKKSVFGLSDSFAKFTGSVAKGLSVATQDREFQERRRLEQRKARGNQGFNGFGTGATSFVNGITSGLRGMAVDPFTGASQDGMPGFFKGLGKGIVGLPTKTAVGVLDLASNFSEGIRNTTTVLDGSLATRVRLPRYVGFDQIIKPFNERESQGQFWLKTANGGELINDKYLAHVVLPGKQLAVIVSMSHVIEIRLSSLEIMWKVKYSDVKAMTLERAGLVITLRNASSDLFVPISDSHEKRFLYKNLSIAVNEYNKYCQVEL
ncbi:LAMI_0F04874g1_1 [Lachancea mirantina]|uniref:Vacuolar protein sorting-associated protein n=1 Tax=Lachancea mirantina TaxID=1230905 RepID=A0A1G4JXX6_9SACH|nr:LAMI_0F04874g1_1 [Lachancea mirantina]